MSLSISEANLIIITITLVTAFLTLLFEVLQVSKLFKIISAVCLPIIISFFLILSFNQGLITDNNHFVSPEEMLDKANTYLMIDDYKEAAELYQNSMLKTNPSAQNNLGVLFTMGQGVEENEDIAIKYFNNSLRL